MSADSCCPLSPPKWGDCSQPGDRLAAQIEARILAPVESAFPSTAPGDALAAQIEARVLVPIEQAIPAAAPIVAAVRKCGGCTQAKHAMGSREVHPDSGSPVL